MKTKIVFFAVSCCQGTRQNFDPTQDGSHLGPKKQGQKGEGELPGGRLQKWVLRGPHDAYQKGHFRSAGFASPRWTQDDAT